MRMIQNDFKLAMYGVKNGANFSSSNVPHSLRYNVL